MGFVSVLLILFFPFIASAQMPGSGPAFWKLNGTEYGDPIEGTAPLCLDADANVSVQATSTRLIIGGSFIKARTCTGSMAAISKTTSHIASGVVMPKVDGSINAIISDGNGGWYIGGTFSKADDLTRIRVARVNSDGSVNATFVGTTFNAVIYSLLLDGGDLYVGGNVSSVSGTTRYGLVKLDATTGSWNSSWNPGLDNTAAITSLLKIDGKIYAGGTLASANGVYRKNMVILDPATAALDPVAYSTNSTINAMKVVSNTLLLGGTFSTAGYGGNLSLLNASGTQVSSFPNTNGAIYAITPDGNGGWYIGGTFTLINGIARNRVAHIDASNTVTAWNPNANGTVNTIYKKGSVVYLGGTFGTINGSTRNYLAAVNDTDGTLVSWNVSISGTSIDAISSYQNNILIAGNFSFVNGQNNPNFAALDETTGSIVNPQIAANAAVSALHIKNDKL